MNYVINLLESNEYNAILTIVNRLTKERYYISCVAAEENISIEIIAELLIREIFRIHNLLVFIISNRDS